MSVIDRNFVVFEGPDFSGKSTLMAAVIKRLEADAIPHVALREPGGTEFGERLRKVIISEYNETIHPEADILAHMAYRIQNVREIIAPNLKEGKWVLTDRFLYSTWCLQVQANLDTHPHLPELMMGLMPVVTGGLIPEPVVFLVNVPKETRDARKAARVAEGGWLDRYESYSEAAVNRIEAAYEQMHQGPSTFVIDGLLPLEEQVEIVLETIRAHEARVVLAKEDEEKRRKLLLEVTEGTKKDEEEAAPVAEQDLDPEFVDPNPVPNDFDLEASLEKYAQENVVDALFDEVPRDELESVKAEYRGVAKEIAREIFERTGGDQTIFSGSRVGQLNQQIHSLFYYGIKLLTWKSVLAKKASVDESTPS